MTRPIDMGQTWMDTEFKELAIRLHGGEQSATHKEWCSSPITKISVLDVFHDVL